MNTNFSGFLLSVFTLLPLANVWSANNADSQISYPINGIPFTQVKISADSFWGERLAASRDVTVPLAFSKCQETNRYTNFQNAAARMKADAADVSVDKSVEFDNVFLRLIPYYAWAHRGRGYMEVWFRQKMAL